MDEYQMIEIAKRFRMMEDATEKADTVLARLQATEERHMQRHVEHAYTASGNERIAHEKDAAGHETQRDQIAEIRLALESSLEACREDMVAMQESIRNQTVRK